MARMQCWCLILALLLALDLGDGSNFGPSIHSRLSVVPPPPEEAENRAAVQVTTKYFDQVLDHFNSSASGTWKQRYQVNEGVYEQGGPIFVMIGGEGAISAAWLTWGQMYENAKAHNALIFQLEHRFYGESHPTSDVSIANLRYLSSTQALADLDAFIKGMKEEYEIPDAKVVVFGGSYPGNLAIWYRELYPDSTVGAVVSSAPVLAEDDFIEYMEVVGDAQKYFNPPCYDAVSDAFSVIGDLVAAQDDAQLDSILGICDGGKLNYSDPWDIQTFYGSLVSDWMSTTLLNQVGNSSDLAKMCQVMTNETYGDPIHRLASVFHASGQSCAYHDYVPTVTGLKQESWDSYFVQDGLRQWFWQTCNEFGFSTSNDSKDQPFGFETVGIKYLEDIHCTQPFGITHDDIVNSVALTNRRYGGKTPNVTNVFLINNSIDPWHTLSIFDHDINESSPSRYIEGTSHCYDMFEARPDDPPALTKARQEVADKLSEWLA